MHYSTLPLVAVLATAVSAHGVVTSIQGANGVTMPGLSADTAIIRDREINSGSCGPLGRTQGNGPISAETMILNFMGEGAAPATTAPPSPSASRTTSPPTPAAPPTASASSVTSSAASPVALPAVPAVPVAVLLVLLASSAAVATRTAAPESGVASSAGVGASEGLPTCADDGTISMTYRQINQDGAGPLEASIDATSGGTDPDAFQTAEVSRDVPGLGVQGISLATNTDFPLEVQMPAGMTCEGTVAGVENVCVVRVRNGAAAGPFGGSAAFTQGKQKMRAIKVKDSEVQVYTSKNDILCERGP
ncbi:unnamed protein product [Parascedosporium putredinis]|uniref:Uncharacterized protein n=1 Tax=Parascedosporium putredinis TaxID=1442378 RepID=A0A9P1H3M2_9PEZI|nr:unnamed protein product [Parascedosporium putredinis]CAI7994845.1 unnamed protein product [Parascedosporium putredinis]